MKEIYIVSAVRTPIGSFNGALKAAPATSLGAAVIRESIERAGIQPDMIGEVQMGCALQSGLGQAPARQAALEAGVPNAVPCTTINKVCGSGLAAVTAAARAIACGEVDTAVAGGMESMSRVPYALPGARSGYRLGDSALVDLVVHDGLTDAFDKIHMGVCTDRLAAAEGISREAQDDYAIESYRRAIGASEAGLFAEEIIPVVVPDKKGARSVSGDEGLSDFNEAKLRGLRPVFREGGTVTAGNASGINDGAAALLLAGPRAVADLGLTPLARVVSFGAAAGPPAEFPLAPIAASRQAAARAGLSMGSIDLFEINEAFAAATVLVMRRLDLAPEKVNVRGGAVAIGHPIGASGARILTTLVHAMRAHRARSGLATLCIGGGEGLAMILESA